MHTLLTHITEQCGARWAVYSTAATGARALWIFKAFGPASVARPHVVGFYAPTINAAADTLCN